MMDAEYQDSHRQFVSGHNGSDPVELLLVGAPVHGSHLLLVGLAQLLGLDFSSVPGLLLEGVVLVLPTLLSLTLLSDFAIQISTAMLTVALISLFISSQKKNKVSSPSPSSVESAKCWFLSNHRALMIVFTTVGILAVDFPVFPRKFAKTETYGYGWMDLGVGSFTLVNGLVSPEARRREKSVRENLSGCLPLVTLGLLRLLSVSLLGYHENVAEYGKHWNFFFSLAAVRLLSTLVLGVVRDTRSVWVTSLVICILYEGALTLGLADWILSPHTPRDDLISANREGLSSSLGYLALYLAGVSWGQHIFSHNDTTADLWLMLKKLLLWCVLMWLSLGYSLTVFLPPSRRLANYTFFTWILAYNLTVLSVFLVTDLIVTSSSVRPRKTKTRGQKVTEERAVCGYRSPQLVSAVDYNPLLFFLLANIATGLVNMTVPTIHTDGLMAVAILVLYEAGLGLVITLLYRYKMRFKFW